MRLLKSVPELEEKLQIGSVSLSTASQLQNFLRVEKRLTGGEANAQEVRELVQKIEGLSTRQTEALLAARSPRVALTLRERPRSVDGENVQVTVILTPALQEKLRRLRDRMAHQHPNPTLAEQIELLANFACRKWGISESPAITSTDANIEPHSRIAARSPARHIPTSIRREVWRRAGGRCEHRFDRDREISSGAEAPRRWTRTHLLQVDHRIPVAWGGTSELDNLQLLCAVHNQRKSDYLPTEIRRREGEPVAPLRHNR